MSQGIKFRDRFKPYPQGIIVRVRVKVRVKVRVRVRIRVKS